MTKKIFLTLLIFIAYSFAEAHEFWIQPKKFRFTKGETMVIDFAVGENFEGKAWDLKLNRVTKLHHLAENKSVNLMRSLKPGEGKNLALTFQQEGPQLLVMQSNNAAITLSNAQFDEYLKEEGLEDILEHRNQSASLTDSVRENYTRCAKLLVQVGEKGDDSFRKVAGLTLEIIPITNPYMAVLGDEVKFRVLYNGKPLAFTQVKIWNKGPGKTFVQNIYTDKNGVMSATLSNSGTWMISTVKMIHSPERTADFQSYWSSLVFGI